MDSKPPTLTASELNSTMLGTETRLKSETLEELQEEMRATASELMLLAKDAIDKVECVFTHFTDEEVERDTIGAADEECTEPPEPCACSLRHPTTFTWARQFAPAQEIVDAAMKVALAVATHE